MLTRYAVRLLTKFRTIINQSAAIAAYLLCAEDDKCEEGGI
jgi:hypothetical protein